MHGSHQLLTVTQRTVVNNGGIPDAWIDLTLVIFAPWPELIGLPDRAVRVQVLLLNVMVVCTRSAASGVGGDLVGNDSRRLGAVLRKLNRSMLAE